MGVAREGLTARAYAFLRRPGANDLGFLAMGAGVWNILMGLAAIAAGASGRFSLIGTNSSVALIVLGVVFVIWGIIQIVRQRRAPS